MASPTPTPAPKPTEKQPKVVQKLLVRTFIFLVIVSALIWSIQWYQGSKNDMGANQTASTVGWITAVEYKDDGQEVVAIKPDQSVVKVAGWQPGNNDRDAVWARSGHFIFFISDRTDKTFHIYRWNPETTEAEIRTVGTRGRSNPTYKVNQAESDQSMLVTSGGVVMEFDPTRRSQTYELPPLGKDISISQGDEQGAEGVFTAMYGQIGTSFRYARWCGAENGYVAAIMKRDQGDVLIVQDMKPGADGKVPAPSVIAAGEHIDLDVDNKGQVLFSINDFQWIGSPPPDFIKNGKVTVPYRHFVGLFDPAAKKTIPIVLSMDDTAAYGSPTLSPDGKTFVSIVGPFKDGAIEGKVLVLFPVEESGGTKGKAIIRGNIHEPSWDPTGDRLVYARTEGSSRSICVANKDGSSERTVTAGTGNYGFPRFSPQTK